MNETGNKVQMGKDTDFNIVLSQPLEIQPSVYYAKISLDENNSYIRTYKSDLSMYYSVKGNQTFEKVSLKEESEANGEEDGTMSHISGFSKAKDKSQEFHEWEIEDIEGYKEPLTKYFLYPRHFVIGPDGRGKELLSIEQLDYYFRVMKLREEVLK